MPSFLSPSRLPPLLAAASVFALALALLGASIGYRENQLVQEGRARATDYLSTIRARIESAFNSSIYLTSALDAVISSHGYLSMSEFDSLAGSIIENSPHIRNVGLAEDFVITRMYPLEGNESALGFDYRSHPGQWRMVKRAIEERKTLVSGPLELVQGGVAVIIRKPIFVRESGTSLREKLWGLSSVVINFDTIVEQAGLPDPNGNYRVAIRGRDGAGPEGAVFWGEPTIFEEEPVTMSVNFPYGSWQLAAAPTEGWQDRRETIWLKSGAGLIALLLAALAFIVVSDGQRLRVLALHDALTGLPNRSFLQRRVAQAIAHARRHERLMALAVLDLNGFKPVNDTYGHQAGDHVLTEVARRVRGKIREEDTLARTGGDEFALLLTEIIHPNAAVTVAMSLADAIREPIHWEGQDIVVAVSIGISIYPEHGEDLNALFRHADLAMYGAKSNIESDWGVAS